MLAWIALLLAIVLNTTGNVFIKMAGLASSGETLDLIFSWPFFFGAALFGLSLVFYAKAQSLLPLSVVYPVLVGGTVITISLVALTVFGERLGLAQIVGMAMIIGGIILLSAFGKVIA